MVYGFSQRASEMYQTCMFLDRPTKLREQERASGLCHGRANDRRANDSNATTGERCDKGEKRHESEPTNARNPGPKPNPNPLDIRSFASCVATNL